MLVHLFKMIKILWYSLNERHLSGKVICIHYVSKEDTGMFAGLWHLVPYLSSPPFTFFFSCYRLITLFPLSSLLRLFYCSKFLPLLSHGIFRWAWYFFTSRKQMLRYRTFSALWIKLWKRKWKYRKVSKPCYMNKKS